MRSLDLFSEAIVAIDGSKFKAVNNRDKNLTDRSTLYHRSCSATTISTARSPLSIGFLHGLGHEPAVAEAGLGQFWDSAIATLRDIE